MLGLGTQGDTTPDDLQPPLIDGIHLRWSFKRNLGFPWYGFYLFRRPHRRSGERSCISNHFSNLQRGPYPGSQISFPVGQISSDQLLLLTDSFPPSGQVEFDLERRRSLRFSFSSSLQIHEVEVTIGFYRQQEEPKPVLVTALLDGIAMAQVVVKGRPDEVVRVTLTADQFNAVECSPSSAALIDLCYSTISEDARSG